MNVSKELFSCCRIELKMVPPVNELKAMTDAFDGIDKLAEGAPRTDGAPNFRRVSFNHDTNTSKEL